MYKEDPCCSDFKDRPPTLTAALPSCPRLATARFHAATGPDAPGTLDSLPLPSFPFPMPLGTCHTLYH